jgi:hypothetical protein
VFDNAGMFDPTTGTITAPIDGVYMLMAGARWEADSAGIRNLHIVTGGTQIASDSSGGDGLFVANNSVTTIARLTAGDTVIARVVQTTGSDLKALEDQRATFIAATWLSP